MSLTFFIDHCVPASIGQFLRKGGHRVLILKDYLLVESPDEIVITKAQELAAIRIAKLLIKSS